MIARRATVRLQLHAGFTLDDAKERVPYYAAMGISHFYLSPVSCSVPGSLHGYDVVDPARINPQLGGEPAFRALSQALRVRGMGILLDIVPNHMATHPGNAWWWDVLARGEQSRYAQWFDIEWRPADESLRGKVLAPFLADDYAACLERGDMRLVRDSETDTYLIQAGGQPYPVADATLEYGDCDSAAVLARYDPASHEGRGRLHELLEHQHYRLCNWRCAAERINWRRFFEISGLIGVRVENPRVFDAVHELPLRLYEEGMVDGLRIDHVDGLARPLEYCRRLRQAMRERRAQVAEPWVVVEKILAHGETLDERWQVDGTTGYDFMDQVGAVLHDEHGCAALVDFWKEFTGSVETASDCVLEARVTMLRRHFVAERRALVRRLHDVLRAAAPAEPCMPDAVDRVLEAFLAGFPVYRSYIEGGSASAQDAAVIQCAANAACARLGPDAADYRLLDRMVNWLPAASYRGPDDSSAYDGDTKRVLTAPPGVQAGAAEGGFEFAGTKRRCEVVRRFEQLTPPLAAKSLEDTVFYRYGPFLARNEVGSDPQSPALDAGGFHACNVLRAARYRAALLATASHDHKRGEDARARLAVLSENVDAWRTACDRWSRWSSSGSVALLPKAELYMLWQTLVGAWPLDLDIHDAAAMAAFGSRIVQWQRKALREAKLSSSWFDPNPEHEARSAQYVYELLGWPEPQARRLARAESEGSAEAGANAAKPSCVEGHDPNLGLVKPFHEFVQGIAPAGAVNGMVQAVLRMTVPGVPDLYQGTEWWDFSLVDPDNRRPFDYVARQKALGVITPIDLDAQKEGLTDGVAGPDYPLPASVDFRVGLAPLLAHWRDGRIKQAIVHRLLALRAADPDIFCRGGYEPLETTGPLSERLIAFARRHEGRQVIVVVPRLCAMAIFKEANALPRIDMTCWKDTGIMVAANGGSAFRDIFTGGVHRPVGGAALRAEHLLAELPCAVLTAA